MTSLPPLKPDVFLSDFQRGNIIHLTRADQASAKWLPNAPGVLDWLACGPRTVLGTLGRFVHRAATGPVSLQLNEWTGLTDNTRHVYFAAESDCLEQAQSLSRDEDAVLICQHYPHRWRDFDIRWRATPAVISELNNKANLDRLVSAELAPRRRIVAPDGILDAIENVPAPFVLKVGTPLSSGGSCAATVCAAKEEARAKARTFLAMHDPDAVFIIEDFYAFTQTWCANIGIFESERRYFGAAQQILDDTRKQTGNYNGGPFAAPDAVRDACLDIAERAYEAGYRGVAGMDMGLTPDGKLIVFDLNFRMNSCTAQILYHESACARVKAAVSRNCVFSFARPLAEIAKDIEDAVKQGVFVPLASFDKALHETAGTGCNIAGIALGVDTDEANAVAEKIAALC
ncbi:hypothetical protein [Hyphococcus sp.]|jgi:hypothetical protein|uniref:hypothetical protein n=1 Tax=Hyphococcus sp. TaxID=2038636 RepID=UPI003D14DFF6